MTAVTDGFDQETPQDDWPTTVELVIATGGKHVYRVTGDDVPGGELMLPSVTTLLRAINKPALVGWAAAATAEWVVENMDTMSVLAEGDPQAAVDIAKGAPWRHRDKAAARGSEAHRLIAAGVPSAVVAADPSKVEVAALVESWELWLAEGDFVVIDQEVTVASLTHGWAGTLDVLVRDEMTDQVGVIDIKTGRSVVDRTGALYPENPLQVAAYAACDIGHEYGTPTFGAVLHLTETGATEYTAFADETQWTTEADWAAHPPPLSSLVGIMDAVTVLARHLGMAVTS